MLKIYHNGKILKKLSTIPNARSFLEKQADQAQFYVCFEDLRAWHFIAGDIFMHDIWWRKYGVL